MLKMISWTQWIGGISILTGLYYFVITARYYRTELAVFIQKLARARSTTKEKSESEEEKPDMPT